MQTISLLILTLFTTMMVGSPEWPVPPTNQTKCYNYSSEMECPDLPCDEYNGCPMDFFQLSLQSFCGQDPQYSDYAAPLSRFIKQTIGSEVIVSDTMTNLDWQKDHVTDKTWEDALDYCEDLDYADQTDWRLPNMHELAGLVDYEKWGPATSFPDMPSSYFWSSNKDLTNRSGIAWIVGYSFGTVRRHVGETGIRPVRCVRGEEYVESSDRFITSNVNGQEIVKDQDTGLIWQKMYVKNKTWRRALSYCEKLVYGGRDDWRLPNVNEGRSLINLELVGPSSSFPDMPSDYYWVSTTNDVYNDHAWCIHYPLGSVLYTHKWKQWLKVRCVCEEE